MPWFFVDDQLATHPKVLTAGNAAMGLWVRCGSWSSGHGTDGYVPRAALGMLSGDSRAAEQLVTACLWLPSAGGYQFHDWAQWQRSRAEAEELKEARRRAGRSGGLASARNRRTVHDA